MILLRDIKDYIDSLGLAEHSYCGILPDKEEKSIGVYNLKSNRVPVESIGGDANRSYGIKGISFLVHWTDSPADTEAAAIRLHETLRKAGKFKTKGHTINFIKMLNDEPVSVDTDENGIFEYVVECLFYYDRQEE